VEVSWKLTVVGQRLHRQDWVCQDDALGWAVSRVFKEYGYHSIWDVGLDNIIYIGRVCVELELYSSWPVSPLPDYRTTLWFHLFPELIKQKSAPTVGPRGKVWVQLRLQRVDWVSFSLFCVICLFVNSVKLFICCSSMTTLTCFWTVGCYCWCKNCIICTFFLY